MWPNAINKIEYRSKADDSFQPAMFFAAPGTSKRPLLVGLHQWSARCDEENTGTEFAAWCIAHDWNFIYPDFRGPNNNPDAAGSDLALRDIVSCVDYATANASIDQERVYLAGVSGGGHAALLAAARFPRSWAAVSAWVPMTDLISWYDQCRQRGLKYANDIAIICGGNPCREPGARKEAARRSPLTYLKKTTLPIDINAGIRDGHKGSVPVSHSLWAFNAISDIEDRFSAEDIDSITEGQHIPPGLKGSWQDPSYGTQCILLRRQSGSARLTIFDGGHEIITGAALQWLSIHRRILQ